jgi:hypothetical protein
MIASRFLFVFHGGALVNQALGTGVRADHRERWRAFISGPASAGHIEPGGHPVDDTGRTIRGPKRTVLEGPYERGENMVTGTLVVLATDLEEATSFALKCPIYDHNGSVEVRPILARAR